MGLEGDALRRQVIVGFEPAKPFLASYQASRLRPSAAPLWARAPVGLQCDSEA